MSKNQNTFSSYSSTSYTSSTTSTDGQSHTKSYSETANYDSRTGGNIVRESRESGQPTLVERTEMPRRGQLGGGQDGEDSRARIEDVTDRTADQEYEERIEDEYAKREGGA